MIEIENPNRVAQKAKKVTQIELDEPKQLSRRERCVLHSHIIAVISGNIVLLCFICRNCRTSEALQDKLHNK